jgi:uncharacterized OB-fold protein
MTQQTPIHPGLFTWPDAKPELLGSRCDNCGETRFPAQSDCTNCSGRSTHVVKLGDRGTLWTWTIQSFMPKSPYLSDETPETFTPYAVGYVEMPGGVRVESRLHMPAGQTPAIGMPLQLHIIPFRTDSDGNAIMTFSFSPLEESV